MPTDFTHESDEALVFAIGIAKQIDEPQITLVDIIRPAHPGSFAASGDVTKTAGEPVTRYNVEMMRQHEDIMENKIHDIKQEYSKVEGHVRFSDRQSSLNKFVEEFQADMIVTYSVKDQSFLEKLFESRTERIVRKAVCPVIFVKPGHIPATVHNIVLAVDVTEEESQDLQGAIDFSNKIKAKSHLLYVMKKEEEQTEKDVTDKLNGLASKHSLADYSINTVINDNIEDGIRNFARDIDADMIALMTEGKGKLRKLVFGSTSDDLMEGAEKPILISRQIS